MKTKLLGSTLLVALVTPTPAEANAWDTGWSNWCGGLGSSHFDQPECRGAGRFDFACGVASTRLTNIGCGIGDIEVTYPDSISPAIKRTVVLFLHGGGVKDAHTDWHGDPANPYHQLAVSMAQTGMVVIQPLLNIGPSSTPFGDAGFAAQALACIAAKTDPRYCPLRTSCLPNNLLYDSLAMTRTDLSKVVVVGHSSGGVSALYLPEILNGPDGGEIGLRGLIMIDPSKGSYTTQPPKSLAANTPLFHFYPDYYGPLQNSSNLLFRLGAPYSCVGGTSNGLGCVDGSDCPGGACTGPAPVKGSWVPIGIKDSPGAVAAGKHDAQHCLGLEGSTSYLFGTPADHYPYCYPAQGGCSRLPPNGGTCGGASFCAQNAVCQANPALKTGTGNLPWGDGDALRILHRYVISAAACMGAHYGAYYQPWVNGEDRVIDDGATAAGYCVPGMPPYNFQPGPFDPVCANNTTRTACWSANCHWAQGDGQAIRVNNAQVVTQYSQNTDRWYTAYERYDVPTAGAFTERQERNGVVCHAPSANF